MDCEPGRSSIDYVVLLGEAGEDPPPSSVARSHPRPRAVSVDSVACRVAGSPDGAPSARSSPAPEHDPLHGAVDPGLEIFRDDLLQHQLFQAQLRYQSLQLSIREAIAEVRVGLLMWIHRHDTFVIGVERFNR
jgi:hypothetical protein